MASGGRPARSGSAEKSSPVPHTRISDESDIEEVYEMSNKLGQGSFGVVREVIHRKSGQRWACKAVNKEKAGSSNIQLLEREVAILKKVHHPNIIQLIEVMETATKMYLVMECCGGGELSDVLKERHHFPENQARIIMKQLASAIHYLHKNDMVHRDLKLENILLSKPPENDSDDIEIKVTDFGLSVVKGGVGHDNMMMDFCGTPMYMSPEIIDNKYYSERCDVWAIGVIMYMLLCGLPPFQSKDEDLLYEVIKKVEIDEQFESLEIWSTISEEAKDCLRSMLAKDPAHRLSCHEVLDHPWITGCSKTRPRNVLELMKEWREDDLANGSQPVEGASQSTTALTEPGPSKVQEKSQAKPSNNKVPKVPDIQITDSDQPSESRQPRATQNPKGGGPRCHSVGLRGKSRSPPAKDSAGARFSSSRTPAATSTTFRTAGPNTKPANGPPAKPAADKSKKRR